MADYSKRDINYSILDEIKIRWSPRALSNEKIDDEEIKAIIEAARLAPSCFNEQPWRFLYAHREDAEKFDKILGVVTDTNRIWAKEASVIMIIYAIKKFKANGRENPWNMFDTGTAWGFMSLEATKRGICTHAMGGFDKKRALEDFGLKVNEEINNENGIAVEYTPCAVVAIARYGNPEMLPDEMKLRELPSPRLPLSEIIL